MKTKFYKFNLFLALFVLVIPCTSTKAEAWPFTLHCPPDVTVSCTDELWDLSIYGNATYSFGYQTYSAGIPKVKYFLNSCNTGYITRTWSVEDNMWNWHTCTQTIYVSSSSQGGPNIIWPKDLELTGCNPETNPSKLNHPYNYPTWDQTECGMFGKSYSDMVFTVNNQCKKIMRTWKVMDWCQQSTYGGFTVYSRVQYIYIINAEVPQITCPAQITIESSNCKNAVLNATPIVVSPGSCGGQPEVTNDSPYATSGGSNISGVYPIGTTKVTYRIKYGCGFYKFCSTNVVVTNASKPVPYCLGQLVTALMPLDTDHDGKVDNGMVEIWAKDLNKGSYTVCGNQPLIYSFSKNTNETSKTFTCDHIGSNMVEIWVTDSKGAQNYCITEVVVQNNGANIPNCKPKPVNPPTPKDTVYNVHGLVTTLTDTPLKNAEVTLEYKDPSVSYKITYDTSEVLTLDSFINLSGYKLYRYELTQKIIEKRDSTLAYLTFKSKTDSNGKYLFDSLNVKNKVISLKATYNDSTSLFIDHKDVELLTKYLLGEVKFTSYHQYLASDINEDGVIDITDQNILMSFVTGQIKVLPGVHQWYILDAKKSFAKPQDILTSPLPLAIVLDSITKNDVAHAFVAIKKGNISVDPGSATELYTENRVKPILPITINAYPNPFTDVVRFDLSNFESGPVTLVIYSISGQEVYKNVYQNSNNQHSIDVNLADVPEGMLVFRFNSEKMTAVGKLYHNK